MRKVWYFWYPHQIFNCTITVVLFSVFCEITSWCGRTWKLMSRYITEQSSRCVRVCGCVRECVCVRVCVGGVHTHAWEVIQVDEYTDVCLLSGISCYIVTYCRGEKHSWPVVLCVFVCVRVCVCVYRITLFVQQVLFASRVTSLKSLTNTNTSSRTSADPAMKIVWVLFVQAFRFKKKKKKNQLLCDKPASPSLWIMHTSL